MIINQLKVTIACVLKKRNPLEEQIKGKRRVDQQWVENEEAREKFLVRHLQNLRRAVRAEGGGVARAGP